MSRETFLKDPDATLDYWVDWSDWLRTNDVIDTSVWIVPTGITEVTNTNTSKKAAIWLEGGTLGETYVLTNRITTTDGRIDDRSFIIRIVER